MAGRQEGDRRMRLGRRAIVATAMAAMTVATAAGLAWACSPGAFIAVTPQSGPVNTQATVTGSGYLSGIVDVAFTSSVDGRVYLEAQAEGPNFSLALRIPEAMRPDLYYVTGSQPGRTPARATFTVTEGYANDSTTGLSGSSESGTGSGPGTGSTSGADRAGSGPSLGSFSFGGRPAGSSAPADSTAGGALSGPASTGSAPGGGASAATGPDTPGGGSGGPAAAPGGQSQAGLAADQGTSGGGSPPPPSLTPTPTGSPTGQPAPASGASGLTGTASASGPAGDLGRPVATAAERAARVAAVSPRTATADLWSGLAPGHHFRGVATLDETRGGAGYVVAGMAIATGAMAALAAGFGVAEVRRRRVLVAAAVTMSDRSVG